MPTAWMCVTKSGKGDFGRHVACEEWWVSFGQVTAVDVVSSCSYDSVCDLWWAIVNRQ